MIGNPDLDKSPHSIKILILDWDQTITNKHMHSFFSIRHYDWLDHPVRSHLIIREPADYNSGKKKAVTEKDIENFLEMEGSGIKNAEQLKSVLKNAFNNKVEVAIASFTNYPNAVEYVVQNHLGLSKEQAESIKVVGGLPPSKIRMEHGKNLHILTHILESLEKYKEKHDGALPTKVEVMLVDDDQNNIDCIEKFKTQISELLGLIKNNKEIQNHLKIGSNIINTQITAEDLEKIDFELTGVKVPRDPITEISEEDKQKEDYDYLDQADKWVGVEKNVHSEKLKGSIDKEKGQKRTVKFVETVKVQYFPPEEQEAACTERQMNASNGSEGQSFTVHIPVETSTKPDNGDDGRKNSGNHKPQPWKKGLVIVAPLVIGLIIFGSLTKAVPLSPLNAFGIGIVIAALTVIVYVLEELLLKPELKPKSILKELGEKVKNLFAKEEKKPSCTIS